QARHRTDRGQRFAAEPQAHYPFQVFQVANLAGGVTRERQRQVFRRYARAIVAYPQQFHATLLDFHIDAAGTRVQAVLEQLLDHRSRPFDHFPRRDLVRQPRIQQLDTRRPGHGWDASVVAGICKVWPTLITSPLSLLAVRSEPRLTW